MVHTAIKIIFLVIVIYFIILGTIVGGFVFFFILLPSGPDTYLRLEFIEESYLEDFNRGYVNLTFTDLSPYPTLWDAIQTLIDPASNLTGISLGISSEERHRILDELLPNPARPKFWLNYCAYYEHRFYIGFIATD